MELLSPVVKTPTGYRIAIGSDHSVVIRMGGQPAVLGPGWSPRCAYAGFETLLLLDLQHVDGSRAGWYLDPEGSYVSGSATTLPPDLLEQLRGEASRIVNGIIAAFLTDPAFSSDPQAAGFFALNPVTRNELLQLSQVQRPEPVVVDASAIPDVLVSVSSGGDVLLPRASLDRAMSTGLEERYGQACRTGVMSWPSPVDGVEVTEMRSFALWHVLLVWRCVDRRNGLVFFVIGSGFGSPATSLWIPGANALVYSNDLQRGQLNLPETAYAKALIDHLLEHGAKLQCFLDQPVARFAQYTWPSPAAHIGHFHWNELPGLEKIVQDLPSQHYPLVYDLGGASGNAFYGRLSNLFPELRDNIDLTCSSFAQMAAHAYARGIQVLRFSGRYVSADIRRRIADVVAVTPAGREADREAGQARGPIVVLGLRVENRTVADLAGFFINLARRLVAEFGAVSLVLDGHNGKDGRNSTETFDSNLEQRAGERPVDVERQIVTDLREALADQPVRILDCVGMTLTDNLAWMRIADFCVAPWGAGLAKYRWALNLPCYVLVSNICRHKKGDVHIYAGASDMENPTRHVYVSDSLVTDRPDLPTLLDMDGPLRPYYVNYDVDTDGAADEIIEELRQLPRAASWLPRNDPAVVHADAANIT